MRAESDPSSGLGAFGSVDAIPGERIASVGEAGSTVAEFFLEEGAEGSGEEIGGGVGVAELDNADELSFRSGFELMELVEEGMEGLGGFRSRPWGWRAIA